MTKPSQILIVEDDIALRSVLRDYLLMMGYQITEADSIDEAVEKIQENGFDLVLLDLNLPDGDGLDLLSQLRRLTEIPVFVVSGREDDTSRLSALEKGADDYIIKPFNARELELRIKNFLRRQLQRSSSSGAEENLIGNARLLVEEFCLVSPSGESISLTRAETEILDTLVRASGKTCSRQKLAALPVFQAEKASDETITVLIYRLRKKLVAATGNDIVVKTISGVGYRLTTPQGTI